VPHMTVGTERIARGWQPGERIRVPEVARLIVSEVLGLAMANRSLGNLLRDAVTFARVSIGAGLGAYPAIARLWPPYLRAKARMGAFLR
jgi:hypothetical protein